MTFILAVTNQKGGVGKTTSAINLASYLAECGHRVLVVDFDPQGNATSGLSVEAAEEGKDLFDMFFGRVPLSDIVRQSQVERLFVVPSSRDLVGLEIEMGNVEGRELILRRELEAVKSSYDFIFIDCPPSSGLLSLNALGAADSVLIPLQAEYYALEGISALLDTIEFVQQTFNPTLSILGVFLTMFDARTNLSREVEKEAREHFGDLVFDSLVPRSIRLSECPSHGVPVNVYDPESAGAVAYEALASEVEERCFERVGVARAANA